MTATCDHERYQNAHQIGQHADLIGHAVKAKFLIGNYYFEIVTYGVGDDNKGKYPDGFRDYYSCFMEDDTKVPYFEDVHECYMWAIERYKQLTERRIDEEELVFRRGYHHGFCVARNRPDVTEKQIHDWRHSEKNPQWPPGSPMLKPGLSTTKID